MASVAVTLMIAGLYGDYALAGLITAVFGITGALCAPIVGRLMDHHGQHLVGQILIYGFSGSVLALTVASLLTAPPPLLIALAILVGLTGFPVGALTRRRWSSLVDGPVAVNTAFSLESVIDSLSGIVAPLIATFAATAAWPRLGVQPAAGCILVTALLVGLGALFIAQRSTEPTPRPATTRAASISPTAGLLWLLAAYAGVGLIGGANAITFVASAQELGRTGAAGVILACCAAGALVGAWAYGVRGWRSPLERRFVITLAAILVVSALYLVGQSVAWMAGVSLITGLMGAPAGINATALVERLVPRAALTEGLTWLTLALGLGTAVGTSAAGWVIDQVGAHEGFWVTMAGAAIALGAGLLGRRHWTRPVPRQD
jgi:MFS family permease